MAKNRTMAQKHLKAKKEAGKAVQENSFAFMASTHNMSESAIWTMRHKPDYSTVNYKARIAALSHA